MQRLPLIAVLCAALAFPAAAQQPGFGERVEVEVVLIDVVVTDSAGNQILGLTKDDFVVREDGVRQSIDSVDYITSRRLLTGRESNLPFNVEHVKEERYMVFFFDKPEGGAMFQHLARARAAVSRFIDEDMGTRDMVAVVGHDVRLKVYSDFTSDKQQLKRALREAATFSNGQTEPSGPTNMPSILRSIDTADMISGTGTTYQGITVLADALRKIRGRKNLVIFSPGILEPGETVRDGIILNESRFYEPMIRALNASNVSVYAANLSPDVSEPVFHQTLQRMAEETNGDYFRYAVSFNPMISQVEKATGGYYLITYRTDKPRRARGYQKVDVSISNPEFRVKARPGYIYGEVN